MKFGLLFSVVCLVLVISNCTKDKTPSEIDSQLFEMSTSTANFSWYQNNDSLYAKSPGSGHSWAFLKTRYNLIAQTKLDSLGMVQNNAQFPEGSLIVKELYLDSTTLSRYAILLKDSDNQFADDKGWVWGYVNSDGSVAVSAQDKGRLCINCHTQQNHIDYMLMNKYFP